MKSLADFEFNKAPLCDGMILISEFIRDDFPSQVVPMLPEEYASGIAWAVEKLG